MALAKHAATRVFARHSALAVAVVLATSLGNAAEAKTLRVSYYIGASHPLVSAGITPFMEEVKNADVGLGML